MSVTSPPPGGSAVGDAVIAQPLGGGGATATVIATGDEPPAEFEATTENDVVFAIVVVTEADDWPDTPGPVHVKRAGLPLVHVTLSVTDPPPAGNDGGDAVSVQPVGACSALTRTTTDAAGAPPLAFEAITLNVDVAATFGTTSDGEGVDVETPGPVHAKDVGAPPPEHAAVSVTRPPPTGNEDGDEVSVQPLGGGSVLTGTDTDATGAAPLAFEARSVNVDVAVTLETTSDGEEVEVETPGPFHTNVVGVPPEHVALSVTLPPPKGSDDGDDATLQLLGGGTSMLTLWTGNVAHSSVSEKMPQTRAVQSSLMVVDDVLAGSTTSIPNGFIGLIGELLASSVNEINDDALSPRVLVNVTVLAG